ncbi:nucleoside triphosphate pyrophosphohydrolase [Sandaracinus amylolyticus]|uniref:nucleoside triphosphate pyrophosphohydrolase n=1 Tax=Sandaracinus amylolyticus TaxID=927083 RepID=UPI001F471ECA|nr:nucleoside triphosphate pyrophosphohydrolase [Sandaracinus amylolyticus]UJR80459.1 Nucleoside triphosphate pyrophosphohydrolase MazG [Sandaracinus amylolyticus]
MSDPKKDDDALRVPAAAPLDAQIGAALPRFVAVMRRLLGPGGCPWDREQTFETMRPFVVEEAHEVVDAIDRGSPDALREELGDLLMQIVFLAELARARGWFGPDDVVDAISDKMIRRHPHVFGDAKASTPAEVLERWERDKAREKGASGEPKGALDGVPVAMPGLLRAVRIGDKAARVGYDWPDAEGARAKITEELAELDEAAASGDATRTEEELGDLLFAIASWSRKKTIDPEAALRGALDRFTHRFREAERIAHDEGRPLAERSADELDALWRRVKARAR